MHIIDGSAPSRVRPPARAASSHRSAQPGHQITDPWHALSSLDPLYLQAAWCALHETPPLAGRADPVGSKGPLRSLGASGEDGSLRSVLAEAPVGLIVLLKPCHLTTDVLCPSSLDPLHGLAASTYAFTFDQCGPALLSESASMG